MDRLAYKSVNYIYGRVLLVLTLPFFFFSLIYCVIGFFLIFEDVGSLFNHPDIIQLLIHLSAAIIGAMIVVLEIGLVRVSFTVITRLQEKILWITCALLGLGTLGYSVSNMFLPSDTFSFETGFVLMILYWFSYFAIAILALFNMRHQPPILVD